MSTMRWFVRLRLGVLALGIAGLACGPLSQVSQAPPTTDNAVVVPAAATPTAGEAATTEPTAALAEPSATLDLSNASVQLTGVAEMTGVAATAAAVPAGSLEQWAAVAVASSQYSSSDWSAAMATGAPDADLVSCGDSRTAWASSTGGSENDFLQLSYATPVVPTRIDIYEQNKPGSIVQVEVVDETGNSTVVYQAQPNPNALCPRILSIGVTGVTTKVNGVIIRVNQAFLASYDEIDAVNLVGNP